jgi:hypothetical protein
MSADLFGRGLAQSQTFTGGGLEDSDRESRPGPFFVGRHHEPVEPRTQILLTQPNCRTPVSGTDPQEFVYDPRILQWLLRTQVVNVIDRVILFGAGKRHDEVWRGGIAQ